MSDNAMYSLNPGSLKGVYQHYKGNHYEVLEIAIHSETLEEMVIYRALYGDFKIWVRPLHIFLEEVEIEGKKVKRFCNITPSTA